MEVEYCCWSLLEETLRAMAGNFWQSSHCAQWLLDKVDLARERAVDLQTLSEDEYQKIIIFYAGFIQVLGKKLDSGGAVAKLCGGVLQEKNLMGDLWEGAKGNNIFLGNIQRGSVLIFFVNI